MKLISYEIAGLTSIGLLHENKVYNLREFYEKLLVNKKIELSEKIAKARVPNEMIKFIELGDFAINISKEVLEFIKEKKLEEEGIELEKVKLMAPFRPRITICGGANFDDHLDETNRSKPTEVEFFLKAPHTITDPNEIVEYEERVTNKYDYEVELGIIIKKPAKNVKVEDAFDYIFGYTIFNDISARSRQVIPYGENEYQLKFGEGKNYSTGAPMGPWIVTVDEDIDVFNIDLKTWVNDDLRQNNNTKNIIWNVPNLVSYYSQFMTLEPGLLIASGTPGGPALGSDIELGADPYQREDGVKRGGYMKPGDKMTLEIENIGKLINYMK